MPCSLTGFKTCLVICNVSLLFVGVTILILGVKMKEALALLLMDVPVIAKTFKAVISTGFFISVAGVSGIAGACYEILWLIQGHLFFLVMIVIMEFALGVTLMVIRTTVEGYIENPDCNKSCAATLDAVVLDYALPSTGLMMTVLVVEGLMIYSAMKLYLLLRDAPKVNGLPEREARSLQMMRVSFGEPGLPRPGYSPRHSYNNRTSPRLSPHNPPQYPISVFTPKQPDASASSDQEPPPPYSQVVPSASPVLGLTTDRPRSLRLNRYPLTIDRTRSPRLNRYPLTIDMSRSPRLNRYPLR